MRKIRRKACSNLELPKLKLTRVRDALKVARLCHSQTKQRHSRSTPVRDAFVWACGIFANFSECVNFACESEKNWRQRKWQIQQAWVSAPQKERVSKIRISTLFVRQKGERSRVKWGLEGFTFAFELFKFYFVGMLRPRSYLKFDLLLPSKMTQEIREGPNG